MGELRPEFVGLPGEDTEAGAAQEYLVDLPHERPRACQVGEREVDFGELGSGLNGEVGHDVGQGWPEALRPGQFRAGGEPPC